MNGEYLCFYYSLKLMMVYDVTVYLSVTNEITAIIINNYNTKTASNKPNSEYRYQKLPSDFIDFDSLFFLLTTGVCLETIGQ